MLTYFLEHLPHLTDPEVHQATAAPQVVHEAVVVVEVLDDPELELLEPEDPDPV